MASVKKLRIMIPWSVRSKVLNRRYILAPGFGNRWARWGFQCSGDRHRRHSQARVWRVAKVRVPTRRRVMAQKE